MTHEDENSASKHDNEQLPSFWRYRRGILTTSVSQDQGRDRRGHDRKKNLREPAWENSERKRVNSRSLRRAAGRRCGETMAGFRVLRFVLSSALLFSATGCGISVQSLSPEMGRRLDRPSTPFSVSVQVDRLGGEEIKSVRRILDPESGLVRALDETRSFSRVLWPDSEEAADLVLRGRIEARWSGSGVANFFTYWPGGLVFAPAWNGHRWKFRTSAKMELVDTRSGKVVGNYTADTEYGLVHRTGNPLHFFGAVFAPLGILQGALRTWPRGLHKKHLYEAAYPELWRQIAAQIVADLGTSFRAQAPVWDSDTSYRENTTTAYATRALSGSGVSLRDNFCSGPDVVSASCP